MSPTLESLFLSFDRIDKDDHLEKIMFYESHMDHITQMGPREKNYLAFHYLNALFEAGKYEKVLSIIDPLIEYIFINDIQYSSVNTYQHLLLKKARCNFYLLRYEECIILGEQLLGITPDNPEYADFMQRSFMAHLIFKSANIRFAAMVLIFCASIISAIVWYVNTNVQETSLGESFGVIISPCILALAILGGAQLVAHYKSKSLTKKLIRRKRHKKSRSPV